MDFTESEKLELKKTTSELKEAIIAISAILNKHQGGEIYFGITNEGKVVGQTVTDKTIRDISKAVSDHIEPKIFPEINNVTIKDKSCIHARFEGNEIPYYAYGRVYMRVGDENKRLSAKEQENIIIKKNQDLLRWDNRVSEYSLADVNEELLINYVSRAKETGRLSFDYQGVETTLKKLGLMKNNKLLKAVEVLFCNNNLLETQLAVFAGTDKITFLDIKQYKDNVFNLLERTETYVKEHIDWRVEFGELRRKEIPEVPIESIREALVNSYCHRDYLKPESNKIAVFRNRIEIYNPGPFPEGFTPEDFIKGEEQSILRNPLVAETLYKSKEIEKWGSGLKRIYEQCMEQGVRVEFKVLKSGFMAVFYRTEKEENVWKSLGKIRAEIRTETKVETRGKIIAFISENPSITATELAQKISLSKKGVEWNIKKLKSSGILKRIGSTKSGHWEVVGEKENISGHGEETVVKAREETREESGARVKTVEKIIGLISENPAITVAELTRKIGLSKKGIEWNIKKLRDNGVLKRIGPPKGGRWEIIGAAEILWEPDAKTVK
jgi:ATP-dependent DNA helicase RecG